MITVVGNPEADQITVAFRSPSEDGESAIDVWINEVGDMAWNTYQGE